VFSIAVILFEMIQGRRPNFYQNGSIKTGIRDSFKDEEVIDLFFQMIEEDPNKRISI